MIAFLDIKPMRKINIKKMIEHEDSLTVRKKNKILKRKEHPSRKEALYENCRMLSPTGQSVINIIISDLDNE